MPSQRSDLPKEDPENSLRTFCYQAPISSQHNAANQNTMLKKILSLSLASILGAHAAGNDWMSCLNGALPISQLSIPGTHDSGALLEPFPGTARTQSLTLDQQLAAGVRFFDIRCNHTNNQFAIFHGPVPQGITFDIVLLQVNTFLDANPGETLIMSVKEEFTASNNTRSFEETFDSYVAQNPDRWLLSDHTPTLEEARGKIVLFRRFGASSTPKGMNASSFPDNTTFTTGNRLRVQDRYVVSSNDAKWDAIFSLLGEAKYGGPNTLYVNFCSGYQDRFGTPDITVVSNEINARLANFFTSNTSGHYGTILMDFADAAKCELIYQTNLEENQAVHRPAYFSIVNRHSGKAIDLIGGNSNNGAEINQWNHDAGPNQRWSFAPNEDGSHFRITSWQSSRCFMIEGNATAPGAKLLSFENADAGSNPGQHFDLIDAGNGYFKIRNVRSNLVLEVENSQTADNARIQQNSDTGAANQEWRLRPWGDYHLRTNHGTYLAVEGSAITQQTWQKHPANEWAFSSSSDGYLLAAPLTAPGRSVSIPDSDPTEGVAARSLTNGGQNLRIEPLTDGSFKFSFAHSGLAWEAANDELHQMNPRNTAEQNFQLERLVSFPATLSTAEYDWRCHHFDLADLYDPAKEATHWGRHADPDGDQISNFHEFAFGGDPHHSGGSANVPGGVEKDPVTGNIRASFARLRSQLLNYELQVSTDLHAWAPASAIGTSATLLNDRYEMMTLTLDDDPSLLLERFVRIAATDPAPLDE
ncbi:phosphatidylinositol-specific phospholipase C domain-containing protein (plasmid) [Verrucomicrobiaceae bacterium 227]